MSKFGLKIAEIGNDVKNVDDDECIINSKYSHLKPFISNTFTYTIPATPDPVTTIIYSHNLGYVPAFQSFIDYDNSGEWRSMVIWAFDSSIYCKANKKDLLLYVNGYSGNAGKVIKVKYYIFSDRIGG